MKSTLRVQGIELPIVEIDQVPAALAPRARRARRELRMATGLLFWWLVAAAGMLIALQGYQIYLNSRLLGN